jgi:hypothetical protein
VVLLEGDAGYSLVAGVDFEANGNGVPDEVILLPSMEDDYSQVSNLDDIL